MRKTECDVAVVGGGPAGLAAAERAKDAGAARVFVIDRDRELGGILQQCIHNGFGLQLFKEDLTGPEYAHRFIDSACLKGVEVLLNSMVLEVTPSRTLYIISRDQGMLEVTAKAVVLAMGCRERNRGAVTIPGTRPAGIFTAGTAQRFVNMEGFIPGKRIVVLGSGDVGLIMARRLTWEGAKIEAILEIMPYPSGLIRNVAQCAKDNGIPLYLCHTVSRIYGAKRLEGVQAVKVDEKGMRLPGTEWDIPCDTLLLSVGLIPENELTRVSGAKLDPVTGGPIVSDDMQTSLSGVFSCGNVVHVHDLVDNVTQESWKAGECAARFAATGQRDGPVLRIRAGDGVRYVVPQMVRASSLRTQETTLYFRVTDTRRDTLIEVLLDDKVIWQAKKQIVRPQEMVSLTLEPRPHLQPMTGDKVCVRLSHRKGDEDI
jgi:NADPH-dependent 2,4-dienoyl-CoA reductase/sulfur reductase-like enzyme